MDNRDIDTLMNYMNGLSIKELQDLILDLIEQNNDLRKERKKDKEIIDAQRVRIKKLKEKYKDKIIPKFKVGDEIYFATQYFKSEPYCVGGFEIARISIFKNSKIYYSTTLSGNGSIEEERCFATEKEAQKEVDKINNGNK